MEFLCPEKTSFDLKLNLKDQSGAVLNPVNAISWWVGRPRQDDPVIPRQEVQDPAADSVINIPAEANICTHPRRDEQRFVIVRAESGVNVAHEQFDYTIRNLNQVPYPEE